MRSPDGVWVDEELGKGTVLQLKVTRSCLWREKGSGQRMQHIQKPKPATEQSTFEAELKEGQYGQTPGRGEV